MNIEIKNSKIGNFITPINNEYLLEENVKYIVKSLSKSFKEHDFIEIGLYISSEYGVITSTNKIGLFKLKQNNIRFISKLGDNFYKKVLEKICDVEKNLLLSSNSINESFGLNYGNYLDEIAISVLLNSWNNGNLKNNIEFILSSPPLTYKDKIVEKNFLKGDFLEDLDFYNLHNSSTNYINFNNKFVPYAILTNKKSENLNNTEIQFLKFFIIFCLKLLRKKNIELENHLNIEKNKGKLLDEIINLNNNIINIKSKFNGFLHNSNLKNVQNLNNFDFTSIKLHNKFQLNYILKIYLKMRKSFELINNIDSVMLNINSIENLYEYYCFLKIIESFNISQEVISTIIKKINVGWIINTKYPLLLGNFNGMSFSIYFKKSFGKFETYSQQYSPDYSIKIISKNNSIFYFHLDAKYKVQNSSVKKEDIDKMHTYSHAIKNTIGSYVLYPGRTNVDYDCENSLVGAIFCNPECEQSLKEIILEKVLFAYSKI